MPRLIRLLTVPAVVAAVATASFAAEPKLPATEREALSGGTVPTADDLVGRWGDFDSCSFPLSLSRDGTFNQGGDTDYEGRWALQGDTLTIMDEHSESNKARVRLWGKDRLIVVYSDEIAQMFRCK